MVRSSWLRRRRRIGRWACLSVELLGARITPAVVLTYGGPGTALTLTELVCGATSVTVSDSGSNTLTIDLKEGSFDGGSTTAATGLTYSTAGKPTASASATIDIGAVHDI